MSIFHPKHSYLNWRAILWRKGLRKFDFFQKNWDFYLFPWTLSFSIFSRIWDFSFFHVFLELWFSWFFRFLNFVWTHLNISSAWQNNQFSFYFSFFFHFFTTHPLRPINANLGKCPRLSVPPQMQVHETTRIISKGFNSGTR